MLDRDLSPVGLCPADPISVWLLLRQTETDTEKPLAFREPCLYLRPLADAGNGSVARTTIGQGD
jgi:hypothetical protein